MKTLNIVLGLSVVALATASFAFAQETAPPPAAAEALLPERFAPEIAHFAEVDASTPPQSCAYLFVGSSSIRFWKSLAEDMAPYPTINRGFGGALVAGGETAIEAPRAPKSHARIRRAEQAERPAAMRQ